MAGCGFPLTRTMTKEFAWAIVELRNRHLEICLGESDNLERSRAEAQNPMIVQEYFVIFLRPLLHKP